MQLAGILKNFLTTGMHGERELMLKKRRRHPQMSQMYADEENNRIEKARHTTGCHSRGGTR
ncbi:MAG: hypothetical protein L6Q71_06160, partial [Planctomycetes bacterium]|nr:hypothetical protein [Planctomycetota bacterium]